ncbi:hypothetical protein [Methylomonas koyamae]|uniref:hypothetical protein n=1 Tax=Methylomonas koyamae TaxID=702114 RepID=UPI001C325720|nr:hypothetical protein [Methylomonas koyamae]WNB76746.1 hypothetical protein RI210_03990 [Methylomonas koyamae]BBL57187.1 hypothetical protein MKFW12EY_08000 [Methylomonas koyamae]
MKKLKFIAMGFGGMAMMAAGDAAFAHASIVGAITSGATGFPRVGLNHACNGTTPPTPIVAQSVVIPTINPTILKKETVSGTTTDVSGGGLSPYFSTNLAGTTPLNSLQNLGQLIQSKDVFSNQIEQRNASNSVIGWVSTKGSLAVNLHGEVPFRFAAPHFRFAAGNANSCVSKLTVQFAVADICNINQKPGSLPAIGSGNNGVNLWIDKTIADLDTTQFPASAIENGAGTTNLTINRDTAINPYPANCAAAGGSDPTIEITVKPSADDIDQLAFPGWGTPASGNTFQ